MAATIISIIALVVSLISLGWQVYSWRRSGPTVVVKTRHAYPVIGGMIGDHMFSITAHNRGRTAVQVTGWGLEAPSGGMLIVPQPVPFNPSLPHVLANGSEATFYVHAAEVERHCAEKGIDVERLRAIVHLGTGQVVRARRPGFTKA